MTTLASVILETTFSALPAAGIPGRTAYTTDNNQIYYDNGISWDNVTPALSASAISAIQQMKYLYAADSGAANAYVVALTPGPILAAGSGILMKVAHANTGASTIAVNGGSAIAIKKLGTIALSGGELAAGQVVLLFYDGTNFQLISSAGSSGSPGFGVPITLPAANGGSSYTLPSSLTTPAASMYFVRRVVKFIYGTDYSISGTTMIIINTAEAAQTGDVHELYGF